MHSRKTELTRSTPSQQGISAEYIINFLNECEKAGSEIHGIMISRNNQVIFEAYNAPYAADIPHIVHSFTKVLTNTAVGLAWDDGLVALDDPLLKYFPEYEKTANAYLKKCTVRDLITMRSGQTRSIGGNEWRPLKTSWKDAYFRVPFDREPGKTYQYSSGNSYILSYIVQKVEGKNCRELVQERIGRKIGLTDFTWMLSPEGVCSGGNGVSLTTEDMLRIGLLYLNKGKWGGEQLLPEDWINYSMGYKDPLPPVEGLQYNFHWDHREDVWAARGMFGQICGLVPSLNIVFAITAADRDYCSMQLFQREIVDMIKAEPNSGKTPNNDIKKYDDILLQKGLRMTLEGKNTSIRDHLVPSYNNLVLIPEENPDRIKRIELHFTEGKTVLFEMEDDRGNHQVAAGLDHWIHGVTTMTGAYLHHQYEPNQLKISAIAWWSDKRTLMMEWRYPEMAFCDNVSIVWKDTEICINRWVNMNSQDLCRPVLHIPIEHNPGLEQRYFPAG